MPQRGGHAALCWLPSLLPSGGAGGARWLLLPVAGGATASCPAPRHVWWGWYGAGLGVQGLEEMIES